MSHLTEITIKKKLEWAKKTTDRLRRQYPSPCAADHPSGTDLYCVGGAVIRNRMGFFDRLLCKYRGFPQNAMFPDEYALATSLIEYNPSLLFGSAFIYAQDIIKANDNMEYAKAWAYVEAALAHTRSDNGFVQLNTENGS